jgi:hypothetical protein
MITFKGESLLMNNLFQENNEYIKYLAVGDDNATPMYTNTSLNNEITRSEATISYDPNQKALLISADFNISIVENACEIGVFTNKNDLITHDIFNELPTGYDSTIHLEYQINLQSFIKVLNWKQSRYDNVYVSLVENTVEAVYEKSTNAGYTPQTNVEDVAKKLASFYYDNNSKQLYINTSNNKLKPTDLDVHILTR